MVDEKKQEIAEGKQDIDWASAARHLYHMQTFF